MADVSDDTLKDALRQRRKHIETNLECVVRPRLQTVAAHSFILPSNGMCICSNLTMKACRKLLEGDLGLPEKSLADRKEFIQRYVDKVSGSCQKILHVFGISQLACIAQWQISITIAL